MFEGLAELLKRRGGRSCNRVKVTSLHLPALAFIGVNGIYVSSTANLMNYIIPIVSVVKIT